MVEFFDQGKAVVYDLHVRRVWQCSWLFFKKLCYFEV